MREVSDFSASVTRFLSEKSESFKVDIRSTNPTEKRISLQPKQSKFLTEWIYRPIDDLLYGLGLITADEKLKREIHYQVQELSEKVGTIIEKIVDAQNKSEGQHQVESKFNALFFEIQSQAQAIFNKCDQPNEANSADAISADAIINALFKKHLSDLIPKDATLIEDFFDAFSHVSPENNVSEILSDASDSSLYFARNNLAAIKKEIGPLELKIIEQTNEKNLKEPKLFQQLFHAIEKKHTQSTIRLAYFLSGMKEHHIKKFLSNETKQLLNAKEIKKFILKTYKTLSACESNSKLRQAQSALKVIFNQIFQEEFSKNLLGEVPDVSKPQVKSLEQELTHSMFVLDQQKQPVRVLNPIPVVLEDIQKDLNTPPDKDHQKKQFDRDAPRAIYVTIDANGNTTNNDAIRTAENLSNTEKVSEIKTYLENFIGNHELCNWVTQYTSQGIFGKLNEELKTGVDDKLGITYPMASKSVSYNFYKNENNNVVVQASVEGNPAAYVNDDGEVKLNQDLTKNFLLVECTFTKPGIPPTVTDVYVGYVFRHSQEERM